MISELDLGRDQIEQGWSDVFLYDEEFVRHGRAPGAAGELGDGPHDEHEHHDHGHHGHDPEQELEHPLLGADGVLQSH